MILSRFLWCSVVYATETWRVVRKGMQKILETLKTIEKSENIRILYAAESGSRAWGFDSSNSDYDVRFIYARRLEHYLSFDVELKRAVIEQNKNYVLTVFLQLM